MVSPVSFAEMLDAVTRGSIVHIGVRNEGEPPLVCTVYEATLQAEVWDPNTQTTLTATCSCSLTADQYAELHAVGAVEDGLLAPR